MKRRTDGDSWNEWLYMRMEKIDADYKQEMLGALSIPFVCVVAWLILAMF